MGEFYASFISMLGLLMEIHKLKSVSPFVFQSDSVCDFCRSQETIFIFLPKKCHES